MAGGLKVYTTVDLPLQKAAMDAVANGLVSVAAELKIRGRSPGAAAPQGTPEAGLIALDPRTGEIKASILILDEIENNIRFLAKEQNEKKLSLHVHPFIEAYLNTSPGFWASSVRKKWQKKPLILHLWE